MFSWVCLLGATDLQAWVIFERPDQRHLSKVGKAGFMGLETEFTVGEARVQVAAVIDGKECKRLNIACTKV